MAQPGNIENPSSEFPNLNLSFYHMAPKNSLVQHAGWSILGDAPVVSDMAQIGMWGNKLIGRNAATH